MKLTATIYDESETAIDVTGRYHAGLKSPRDRFGVPSAPDDEPEIEILDAVDESGTSRHLSPREASAARSALWETLAN